MTGLLAAFMAGMAANVSAFNTVITYDISSPTCARTARTLVPPHGRIVTVVGVLVAIGTAFIAAGYQNIMNYIQVLFSFFNVPLFATFIIGMFWKRMTPWAGFWGMVAGSIGALGTYVLYKMGSLAFATDLDEAFWAAIVAFAWTRS